MIESTLERIAVALEKIAMVASLPAEMVDVMKNLKPVDVIAGVKIVPLSDTAVKIDGETAQYRVPVEEIVAAGNEAHAKTVLDREAIKKQLVALGVIFKVASRTETLQKQLEEALAKTEGHPEEATPAPPVAPAPEVEVTKDMVRQALIDLSTAKGRELPLRLIKDIGNAKNLTEMDGKFYAPLLKACKEAM